MVLPCFLVAEMTNNREMFDRWAEAYDASVKSCPSFPFAGYMETLNGLVEAAQVVPGMTVLDLGTGTGELGGRFVESGGQVWATDFSPRMIEKAQSKFPQMKSAVVDMRTILADGFPARYHRVVSGYAFHHLDLDEKLDLIRSLAAEHLLPAGQILIADVAFGSVSERAEAGSRLQDLWDPSEHYWAADETLEALADSGLPASFTQVSFCAGYFLIPGQG